MGIHKSALKLMIILSFLSLFESIFIRFNIIGSNEVISICKDAIHIIIILFFLRINKNEFPTLNISKPSKKLVFASIFLGILILFLGSAISDCINHFYPGFYNQEQDNPDYSIIYTTYFLIYAGILAPIFEEIEFRRLLLDQIHISNKRNTAITIIISSLMFFAIHTDQFNFGALCLGIVSGLMYYYTKNLFYSILIHFSGNFTVCFLVFIQLFSKSSYETQVDPIDYYVPSLSFIITEIIVLVTVISLILKYVSYKRTTVDVDNSLSSTLKIDRTNYIYVIFFYIICIISTIISMNT